MALISGTTTSYAPVRGIREDLEDTIWELYPEDTWFLTNSDKVDATQQFHEWQSDTLAGATTNRQLEGDDATFATLAPTTRLGNYLQISRKTFLVSGSVEASRMAGRRSELARNARKLMRELKRDMEQALIGNQGSNGGGVGTARSAGGIESWIQGPTVDAGTAGNAVRATTTAASTTTIGFTANVVAAPTDGSTTGALTKTALDSALNGAWVAGGDPRVVLVGATNKAAIDGFTSVATRFVDIDRSMEAPIIGSVNVYISDFGRHTVVLSRYVRSSVVLCLDMDFWATAFLRRPFVESLAKTGDAEKKQILAEFTLVSRNYAASSKVVACA
jgi:hypothetical protein